MNTVTQGKNRALLIIVGLILLALIVPHLAQASLTPDSLQKVTIVGLKEGKSTSLMYRIFLKPEVALPASVVIVTPGTDAPLYVKQSNGAEWWNGEYVQSGNAMTVTFEKGRIIEISVPRTNLYQAGEDEKSVFADIPLITAKGVANVEIGAVEPEGLVCISPENATENKGLLDTEGLVTITMDLSGDSVDDNARFVFSVPGSAVPQEAKPDKKNDQDRSWCIWPLIILIILLVFLCIVYWILKVRKKRHDEELEKIREEHDREERLDDLGSEEK